ncbi:hypothetical protein BX659_103167 [Orenia metallireducens]|jgi:hypothetical protein|uniref:Uncharacterized protein n=1 Tax=Orenia metallireducens TaxID=1413210 RepID=A0A285FP18_9FIRM|nr:hypothetical protein [Orenia metallireducens]PRX33640.1 hypothetical protein BX659_103167 [Orenia metallireducens]SNY12594.1 hypothetical protein SAMN06265827_102167 [Orenia metallireducens]
MKNVIALNYNSAKDLLTRDNYKLQIRHTRPPRKLVGLGELRVIGQRLINKEVVELIISHEDYYLGVDNK